MSRPAQSSNGGSSDHSYFEQQRNILIGQIGESMEQVLQNLNKLNRSLEGMTAVGNEFSAVEALWSHFENVMHKEPEPADDDKTQTAEQTPSKDPPSASR